MVIFTTLGKSVKIRNVSKNYFWSILVRDVIDTTDPVARPLFILW